MDESCPPACGRRERRDLLPLSAAIALSGPVLARGGCRGTRGETAAAAAVELDWLNTAIESLHFHCALRWGPAPAVKPSAAQRAALANLLFEMRVFRDQCLGAMPRLDWEEELVGAATAYDGEEVCPAEPLESARLGPALPSRQACAAARASDVAEGWLRGALLDPRLMLKDPSEVGELPPAPKARASDEEICCSAGS